MGPVRASEARAGDDGKHVGDLERNREPVIGICAERLIIAPEAWIISIIGTRHRIAVFRVITVKPTDPRGGFVIDGKRKDALWGDVEIELGQSRNTHIEFAQRARDAYAVTDSVFNMLPGQFIPGRIRVGIRKPHHSVTQKIIGEAGIAEIRRAHPEYVALGYLPLVRKLQRITLVGNF